MSDRPVRRPVRLALQWPAVEIADGLPNFCDDRAVCGPTKAHGRDVRTDHGPLACPVLAYRLAPTGVAAVHAVGPGDIVGERSQHAVDAPRALQRSSLLTRLIANLDRVASLEASPGAPVIETGN